MYMYKLTMADNKCCLFLQRYEEITQKRNLALVLIMRETMGATIFSEDGNQNLKSKTTLVFQEKQLPKPPSKIHFTMCEGKHLEGKHT